MLRCGWPLDGVYAGSLSHAHSPPRRVAHRHPVCALSRHGRALRSVVMRTLSAAVLLLSSSLLAAAPAASELAALGIHACAGRGCSRGTVSLDLKSADVRRVITLLADVGRYNVVMADDVGGQVTLRLRGVPWRTALRSVLDTRGLDMEIEGNVIFVGRAQRVQEDRQERFMREFCTPERPLPADTFCHRP